MGRKIKEIAKPDTVRLLAKGRGDGHGYTDKPRHALDEEPEAVDKDTQGWISQGGYAHSVLRRRRAEEEELQALMARLSSDVARLHDLGRRRGVDVSSDLRVVQRRFDVAQQRMKKAS